MMSRRADNFWGMSCQQYSSYFSKIAVCEFFPRGEIVEVNGFSGLFIFNISFHLLGSSIQFR